MAAIALQEAAEGLANITTAAAANGDTVAAGGRGGGWDLSVLLLIFNADATSTTVTVAGHPAVIVPATTGKAVVPVFGQPYGGARLVTYSKLTALTVAAVRVGPARL